MAPAAQVPPPAGEPQAGRTDALVRYVGAGQALTIDASRPVNISRGETCKRRNEIGGLFRAAHFIRITRGRRLARPRSLTTERDWAFAMRESLPVSEFGKTGFYEHFVGGSP